MRRLAWIGAGFALLAVALVFWVRAQAGGPPVFVIEDQIEIAAAPEEVWAVLADFESLAEWNPYLLSLTGDPTPGGEIEIVILQENWSAPMTLKEVIVSREEARLFHWHGSLFLSGLMETDHSFAIEPISSGRSRFIHREEFRGALARLLNEEFRKPTLSAFRAMDAALAQRVTEGAPRGR